MEWTVENRAGATASVSVLLVARELTETLRSRLKQARYAADAREGRAA